MKIYGNNMGGRSRGIQATLIVLPQFSHKRSQSEKPGLKNFWAKSPLPQKISFLQKTAVSQAYSPEENDERRVHRKSRRPSTNQERRPVRRPESFSWREKIKKDPYQIVRVADIFDTNIVDEIFARIDRNLQKMNPNQLSQTWMLLGKTLRSEEISSLAASQKAIVDKMVTCTCNQKSRMNGLNWAGVFQGCIALENHEIHEEILNSFGQWLSNSKSKSRGRRKDRIYGVNIDARSISNIIYSIGRIKMEVPLPMWAELLDVVDAVCARANPQDISNVMWALGRVDILPCQRVFQTLEWRICNIADDLPPRAVAMILWGYGRMNVEPHSLVLEGLNNQILDANVNFNSVDVANIYWAYGKLSLEMADDLRQQLENSLLRTLRYMKLKEVINVLWSYSQRAESPDKPILLEIENRIRSLTAMDLEKKSKQSALKAILSAYSGFRGTVPRDLLESLEST